MERSLMRSGKEGTAALCRSLSPDVILFYTRVTSRLYRLCQKQPIRLVFLPEGFFRSLRVHMDIGI